MDFSSWIYQLIDNQISFVIWKKPGFGHYNCIVQQETKPFQFDFLKDKKGFVLFPFRVNEQNPSIWFDFQEDNSFVFPDFDHLPLSQIEKINQKYNFTNSKNFTNSFFIDEDWEDSDEMDFKFHVASAVSLIEEGHLKKIVLARTEDVGLEEHFNIIDFYKKVCRQHPTAFCAISYTPKSGCWICASPETLIYNNKSYFSTMALAGTQLAIDDPKKAQWSQKEIEEQALVSRYIINCFKKIRLREFEEDGPRTVKSGHLLHLRTDFIVNHSEVEFESIDSQMLELLHPTSAVCGMPKDVAFHHIELLEQNTRSYYAGFLGPINIEKETNLFVHLRCAKIFAHKIRAFAGAGITRDSIPDNEWNETSEKLKTLLNLV